MNGLPESEKPGIERQPRKDVEPAAGARQEDRVGLLEFGQEGYRHTYFRKCSRK